MYVRVAGPCSPCSQVVAASASGRIFPPKRTPRAISQWPPSPVYIRHGMGQDSTPSINPVQAATAIVGAIASLGQLAIAIAKQFQGCGPTCIFTSAIANQVQALLLQNLNTYLAQPVHYQSIQTAALATFTSCWQSLVQQCETPANQAAGVNCVGDREQGACKWQTATPGAWVNGQWVPPGPQVSSGGTCWNWWVGFHDPIANDPTVVPDPSPTLASGSQSIEQALGINPSGTIAGIPNGLLLPAGLLLLAVLFL